MKKLEIYIPEENLSEVTEILHKHGVGGMSLSDIKGRGRIPHEPVPETVRFYMTNKKLSLNMYPDVKLKSYYLNQ